MKKTRKRIVTSLLSAEFAIDDLCVELDRKGVNCNKLTDYANDLMKLREELDVELKRIRDENN